MRDVLTDEQHSALRNPPLHTARSKRSYPDRAALSYRLAIDDPLRITRRASTDRVELWGVRTWRTVSILGHKSGPASVHGFLQDPSNWTARINHSSVGRFVRSRVPTYLDVPLRIMRMAKWSIQRCGETRIKHRTSTRRSVRLDKETVVVGDGPASARRSPVTIYLQRMCPR